MTTPETRRDTNPIITPVATTTATTTTATAAAAGNDLIPDEAALAAFGADITANKVASPATMRAVLEAVRRDYPNANAADLFAVAWACYHNGSSRYTTLEGNTPGNIPLSVIKDRAEEHCTFRQFCMFYAKMVYNHGKMNHIPPANWQAKGFKEDAKFAAFDFFTGVTNGAVPKPKEGMKFTPTMAEIAAHAVNATMAISESRQQANQHSTRGNMLAMQQIQTPPTPPLITFES